MVTVALTSTLVAKGVQLSEWTITTTTDGAKETVPRLPLKTVSVKGTWAGGTVVLQESNDGTNWHTAINNAGAAVSFTADGAMVVESNGLYHRPLGTVSVTSVKVELLSTTHG